MALYGYDPMSDASSGRISETTRQANYTHFQDYYNGKHVDQLPGPNMPLPSISVLKRFNANVCDVIVDSIAERLKVSSFLVNDDAKNTQAKQLMKWWEQDRCDGTMRTVHTNSLMLGDSYVIVEWDNKRKRPNFVYNPATLITLKYADVANKILDHANKTWIEGKIAYQNRYYDNRIEYYYCQLPDGFNYMIPDLTTITWVLANTASWLDPKTGEPLGIAVIPFKNQAHGAIYGRSELANVIPLQDAINKTVVDMLLSMDVSAWPILVIKGHGAPKGGWQISPGKAISSVDPNFQVDKLPAGDIKAFMDALEFFINLCFGRSRIPKYFTQIEGSLPSGEAIKAAQEGFISKIKDRQEAFGDSWEDAMIIACSLDNAFGKGSWDLNDIVISTQWVDPENRLALHWAQAISTLAPWLSQEQILRLQGYGEEEIDQIIKEQDQNKQKENDLGAHKLDLFNQGQLPNGSNINLNPAPGHQGANRNPERQP